MSEAIRCVGRDAERALYHEYLDRAIAGDQQLILIEGEAGIGKTILLQAMAREWSRGRRARIFYLSAPEGEPYRPVHHAALAATDQRLYKRVGGRRQATEVARSIYLDWLGALPFVGDILAATVATVERVRRRRSGGLLPEPTSVDEDIEALLAASRRRPLVLLLDELEKADSIAVARLEKLICDADEGARILIVGAYRTATPGDPHPPVRRLLQTLPDADEFFVRRRLGPLAREEMGELLAHRFRGAEIPESFLERLHEATGGHPAAIGEAVADLQFRGRIRRSMRGWVVEENAAMPILHEHQPQSADLGALPPEIAAAVRAASLLGVEFDSATLAHLLDDDELDVEDRLAGAVHFGILEMAGEEVLSNGDIATRFRFASPHVVPLLREGLDPGERALLEERRDVAGTG